MCAHTHFRRDFNAYMIVVALFGIADRANWRYNIPTCQLGAAHTGSCCDDYTAAI